MKNLEEIYLLLDKALGMMDAHDTVSDVILEARNELAKNIDILKEKAAGQQPIALVKETPDAEMMLAHERAINFHEAHCLKLVVPGIQPEKSPTNNLLNQLSPMDWETLKVMRNGIKARKRR